MTLRRIFLNQILTPLASRVQSPLAHALPASLFVLPQLSEHHQTQSWLHVALALAGASALTASIGRRDGNTHCETSAPVKSDGKTSSKASLHSDFLHHLDCEGSSAGGLHTLSSKSDYDDGLASRAFFILVARSAQPQTEQTSSSAELSQARLLVAVQSMGMSHLREVEVHRLWKRFFNRSKDSHAAQPSQIHLSHEQFLEVVAQSSVLQFFVVQVIAREASMNFVIPGTFDYTKPTCDNYAHGLHDFSASKFAEARKGGKAPRFRDYGYHNNYTSDRQIWQDLIIEMTTQKHNPQARPWIVFSCGAMGCGKGYAFEYMSQTGHFPLEKIVRIDPDLFKVIMPEWPGYVSGGHEAGSLTHKESGFIQELCQEVALQRRQNIWVDGSLRDGDWFAQVFDDIRARFPHYRIGIFNVHASEEKVRERVAMREIKTGRGVPEWLMKKSFEAPPSSLFTLGPKTDWVIRVDNETTPTLTDFASHDRSRNWNLVKSRFGKTSPEPNEFPFSLAPIALEVLGPNSIACADEDSVGPLALVGMSNSSTGSIARDHMGIPNNARFFGWVTNSICFPSGGFLFYDQHKHPIGGVRVSGQSTDHERFMEFRGRETHQDIPATLHDTKRWQQVTLPDLVQGGAKEYAFVLPGERGMSGLGGFTYKMDDGTYVSYEIRLPSSF